MSFEINDRDELIEILKQIGNYKLVIPCAGTKEDIGLFHGKRIVAHPANPNEVRPFDKISNSDNKTLYDLVVEEQKTSEQLLPASELYVSKSFKTLTEKFKDRRGDLYILSAGWGIVRSDFKLPLYDITFSAVGKTNQRKIGVQGCDIDNHWKNVKEFNHLIEDIGEDSKIPIVFVGGKGYMKRFYYLMNCVKNPVYILHRSSPLNNNWIFYKIGNGITTAKTNWHYTIADVL